MWTAMGNRISMIRIGSTSIVTTLLNVTSLSAVLVTVILIFVPLLHFKASKSAIFPFTLGLDTKIDASASGIAWTNNGVDIDYNYTGNTTIEIPLEVTKAGNRNYNSATAKGKMKILSPSESTLSISQPGKIYYVQK